jgi:hypothetical protein
VSQNLPIGAVTSPHAVRVRRTPSRPRVQLHVVLTVLGVGAAVAGAVASATPSPVPVRASTGTYEIGGSRLTSTAPGVFQGGGGAAMVVVHEGGGTHAAASAGLDGAHMTGACVLADGARAETCRFTLNDLALNATDTWTGRGWHRRYDDGRTADIQVAGGVPVPVPFAVGR